MAEFYSARGKPKSRRFRGLLCHRRSHLFDQFGSTLENQKNQMTREQRLALFVEKFLELANDLGDTLSPDRTFRISQAGQSGSVQAALASSALRASVPNPSLRNLLRKYQDILNRREEIDRIFAMQASLTTAEQEGPSILQLDKEIQLLETARATAKRNLSTTLRHRRFLFTDSFLLLWKWRVG